MSVAKMLLFGPRALDSGYWASRLAQRRPQVEPVLYGPECDEEWREAAEKCGKWLDMGFLGPRRALGWDVPSCMRGLLSERCGGNPIDWGRWGRP